MTSNPDLSRYAVAGIEPFANGQAVVIRNANGLTLDERAVPLAFGNCNGCQFHQKGDCLPVQSPVFSQIAPDGNVGTTSEFVRALKIPEGPKDIYEVGVALDGRGCEGRVVGMDYGFDRSRVTQPGYTKKWLTFQKLRDPSFLTPARQATMQRAMQELTQVQVSPETQKIVADFQSKFTA